MKIRTGFVSNSSSSSFCLYGACITPDKIEESLTEEQKEIWEDDPFEFLDEMFTGSGINYVYDYEGEYVYIGLNPEDLKDDETGAQFKERALSGVYKVLNNNELIVGGWHAGEIQT